MTILLNNFNDFGKEFVDRYLRNGFGSLSKREIDMLVLYLILKDKEELENPNIDILSIELKIPKTRLRNLYYEMRLKYSDSSFAHDDVYKKMDKNIAKIMKRILDDNLYDITPENDVKLIVSNPYDKHLIEMFLKKEGFLYDYSFSKEIIRFSQEGFIRLVEVFYNKLNVDEDRNEIVNLIKNETGIIPKGSKFLEWLKEPDTWSKIIDITTAIVKIYLN